MRSGGEKNQQQHQQKKLQRCHAVKPPEDVSILEASAVLYMRTSCFLLHMHSGRGRHQVWCLYLEEPRGPR